MTSQRFSQLKVHQSCTIHNRLLLQIFMIREKICWCKYPFGNHILIIFKLKKKFLHLTIATIHEKILWFRKVMIITFFWSLPLDWIDLRINPKHPYLFDPWCLRRLFCFNQWELRIGDNWPITGHDPRIVLLGALQW